MRVARWLVVMGSVILFCTAFVHLSGYSSVTHALQNTGARSFILNGFKALWLMFSIHLVLLSAVLVVASRTPRGKTLVLLCLLIPASDTVLLFHFIGLFIGTILLASATVFLIAGGLLLPQEIGRTVQKTA